MKIVSDLPQGWEFHPIASFIDELESGVSVNSSEQDGDRRFRVLKTSCVSSGRFDPTESKPVVQSEVGRLRCPVRKGSIVISRMNTPDLVGANAYVPKGVAGVYLPDRLWQTVWKEKAQIEPRWLAQLLASSDGRTFLKSISSGTSDTMKNIPKDAFLSVEVPTPPLPEQRGIADILATWDEVLEKLDALIASKERRKMALMQQLLTGKKRMKGFVPLGGRTKRDRFGVYPADWCHVALGVITIEVAARNAAGRPLPVLSCTKHRGLVFSEKYFGKRVYAENTSNYRVVARGEFAYATNHIEEGSIGYQNICEAGLVSPIYTVFKSRGDIDDAYLYRVLKSPLLVHHYRVNTSSSVDRRGSLRYDEFARIHIWLPKKEEQRAIENTLATCDEELRLLQAKRNALDQQKRGLMQKLLTGAIRVRSVKHD
jgi:type I restriction enzyme S subunit